MAKLNKEHFWLEGFTHVVNGAVLATHKMQVTGSWQNKAYAEGFNACADLFENWRAQSEYSQKLIKDMYSKELPSYTVRFTSRSGISRVLVVPYLLCYASVIEGVLAANGFQIHKA